MSLEMFDANLVNLTGRSFADELGLMEVQVNVSNVRYEQVGPYDSNSSGLYDLDNAAGAWQEPTPAPARPVVEGGVVPDDGVPTPAPGSCTLGSECPSGGCSFGTCDPLLIMPLLAFDVNIKIASGETKLVHHIEMAVNKLQNEPSQFVDRWTKYMEQEIGYLRPPTTIQFHNQCGRGVCTPTPLATSSPTPFPTVPTPIPTGFPTPKPTPTTPSHGKEVVEDGEVYGHHAHPKDTPYVPNVNPTAYPTAQSSA